MSLKFSEIFAKTKILATLGPATSEAEMIRKMLHTGVDGFRLNFSHGDQKFYEALFNDIESIYNDEQIPFTVLIDLQGPKIRLDDLELPEIEINTGDFIEISTEKIIGNSSKISTSYQPLADDAQVGDQILIDDGLIRLRVSEKKNKSVICFIEHGGILRPRKGMNLPGMKISVPSITEKDYNDIEFAVKYRADYIALSFVRSPNDILTLKEWLKNKNIDRPVIAKIEKKEAVDNFDEILSAADGIMIARGDLGVELPPQEVPVIQKEIIKKCNAVGKPVITATQMLESMMNNPIPTRAETSDVANAVWDGTDVVMLSGETAVGKYPIRTIQMMNDVILNAEAHIRPLKDLEFFVPEIIEENLFDSINKSIVDMSRQIKASAIVAFTFKGRTAKSLAKYRPHARIIAISDSRETMNRLNLFWGVTSYYFKDINKEYMAADEIKSILKEAGIVKAGDIIIITAGAPYSEKGRANWLRFEPV
jgi:pyruvate kinase